MNKYMLEDLAAASALFGKSAEAAATAPLSKVDTTALYNAGFTAWMVKDYPTAKTYFDKCLAVNYYYEDGEVFAKLADIYTNLEQKTEARDILEKGFTMFPQSQSILIGLINYYLTNNEDPNRLFELIALAKKNEPNNASLYYVEGNIYNELRQADPEKAEEYVAKAVAAYDACAGINAEYEFGYIGKGIMYYNIAIELQDKAANELDDAKWAALNDQFAAALKNAREPFENAYNVSKDDALRVNIAEYLKNIYYRFSSEGPEYEAGYKKYNEVVKTGKPL
jgi:tetratricopeptide (TPR) repeat protein